MAYVGNPIDTQNTFQSLVGKRFNGDGSTTAFTLDVAPSSTLDLEVFVGNVRQDPNSAYTVSGTTLSFTGAPPSGTNNIYVVHQAKSVGTITPGANSVGVTELNLSDGSSGQFIKTDGSGTLSFASVASLAGIDDQSSSNDDQLTITDTAVVINEDSDDVDFRVESNGNANMLFVSGGNDVVGIGAEGDLGVGLHIKSADSGGTVETHANELVVEGSGNTGMTILAGNGHASIINFGDDGSNNVGMVSYDHAGNYMRFKTNGSDRIRIKDDGKVVIAAENMANDIAAGNGGISLFNTNSGSRFYGSGTGTETHLEFGNDNGARGTIQTNSSNTVYNTSSDYRLKENVNYTWDATTKLKQLKPARFSWKTDSDNTLQDGFLAHEVSSIVPEAISGTKDATETKTKVVVSSKGGILAEGVEQSDWTQGKESGKYPSDSTWEESKTMGIYQQIDSSKLVPLLTKALQEAVTKIEALEARVTTLEG